MPSFPSYRSRRLRRTPGLRRAFAETSLTSGDLIAPLFLKEGIAEAVPIGSMPGQSQHTLESMVKEARELVDLGVSGAILFGGRLAKMPRALSAWKPEDIVEAAEPPRRSRWVPRTESASPPTVSDPSDGGLVNPIQAIDIPRDPHQRDAHISASKRLLPYPLSDHPPLP